MMMMKMHHLPSRRPGITSVHSLGALTFLAAAFSFQCTTNTRDIGLEVVNECTPGGAGGCQPVTDSLGNYAQACIADTEGHTECKNVCAGVTLLSPYGGEEGNWCSVDNACIFGLTCDNDTVGFSTCKCVTACLPEFQIMGTYNGKFTCKSETGDCLTPENGYSEDVLQVSLSGLSGGNLYSFEIIETEDDTDLHDTFRGPACGRDFTWEETTHGESGQETGSWTFSDADNWTKESTGTGDDGKKYKCTGTGRRQPDSPPDPLTCAEYFPTF